MRDAMRGEAGLIDYELLAQATARALRKSPPIAQIVDIKAGLARDEFTNSISNH